ncbi:5,6-dimethylbenzimidazole synthase [Roseomonas sp. GC11]|uniref:5,6-dimethylbenzimidazole synthase n=1 Tax=Roseomonas sp. GC11 TaxID=2950546 RepID=UPI00210A61AA|nr:5,6-dimethylbenzimidazole synthase [Roseomonas sp. GC11]
MTAPPEFGPPFRAGFEALLRWRRDVRHFRPDPVPRALLERLLDLADLAPSVGLSQPWRFVVVEAAARRAAVRASFLRANAAALEGQAPGRAGLYARLKLEGLDQAPCQFALFCLPDPEQGHGLGRATMPLTLDYSAVMAAHTLWLAARAEGLGLGWVSILEPEVVRAALDVPEAWRLIGYFCLGWPLVEEEMPELQREGWEERRRTPRRWV